MNTTAQTLQVLFTLLPVAQRITCIVLHCSFKLHFQVYQGEKANSAGFKRVYMDTGPTHSCKMDIKILLSWANLWKSTHKFCTDIYVLASLKETNEPTERRQVDSSVMSCRNYPVFRKQLQQGSAPDASGSGSHPNILCAGV